MSTCVKAKLTYLMEKHNVLPKHQFGGRLSRATINFIKNTWHQNKEVVALFLDMKGAFSNKVPEILAHDMCAKGVPEEVVGWFKHKLKRQQTVITFDDFKSGIVLVQSRLDQGCSTLGLCYNFYNAGQIKGAKEWKGKLAASFVNDTVIAAEREDMNNAAKKVEEMMAKEGGAGTWAVSHFLLYETQKFVRVGFLRRQVEAQGGSTKTRPVDRLNIMVLGIWIKIKATHKFLEVLLNQELQFSKHAAYVQSKGMALVMQTRKMIKVYKEVGGKCQN